ncbi:MFS transporter [Desulforhabdus sp. TSK]|uniref:MFS transporter n=1 Tax=Desulforhabdus sp. TSK TaxID=2925014 RepID=UPI001FC7F08E|nr:MFS transporter [Desulforhabdus sp. TSK]GKT06982.1 MFS transporter [Desulforhabdus sp. TSK]
MQMEDNSRRMFWFLLLMTISSTAGLQAWQILINNFAVEVAHLDAAQMGLVQSIREVPGFLSLLVIYVLLIMSEHKLAAFSVALLGAGLALTGFFPSFWGVTLTTLLMSFGFHYYETVNQSLILQYFDLKVSPLVMGKLRSTAAAASIAIGALIYLMSQFMDFTQMFGILGLLIVLTGCWGLVQDPSRKDLHPQMKKMVLKKRYWLYYTLTFLAGARRQIFIVFAVFLLVKRFDYSVQAVTALFVINNIVNYFANPVIGRMINRFGERTLLSLEYIVLILVFLTYAYTGSNILAGFMYVVDHLVFNFAVAIRTYYQKIADPRDMAAGAAVGFTINHIAAVFVPALGGFLWMYSYEIPFLIGAALSLLSFIFTQFIRLPAQAKG